MPNLYVTSDEVKMWLGIDDYDNERLEMIILMKMDYIDKVTRTTWNGNRRLAKEYHTMSITWFRGGFVFGNGVPIPLMYRDIVSFEKIKVYNLTGYQDITNAEGRDGGYWWCDYFEGMLYVKEFVFYQGGKELYVEYIFGRDDLPGAIKEWCLLLTVRDLIMNDRYVWQVANSNMTISLSEMIRTIDYRVKEIEAEYRPLLPANVCGRCETKYI